MSLKSRRLRIDHLHDPCCILIWFDVIIRQLKVLLELVLNVVMVVLDVLCVYGDLVVLLHIIALKLPFNLKFNSVNKRMLIFFLVRAHWDNITLELLKFIKDLILNIVEIQRQSTRWILCYL